MVMREVWMVTAILEHIANVGSEICERRSGRALRLWYISSISAKAMSIQRFLISLTSAMVAQTLNTGAVSAFPASVAPVRIGDLEVSKPTWWLESRFHFSFADWYDPSRLGWGVLRVVNDDLVKPHAGFGNMEIFTYIVDGKLSHQDSMGSKEALGRGCVQYMSAGTGVEHSEMNEGDVTTRFLQMWIVPDKRGHTPQYGSTTYEKEDRHNKLLQILGGTTPAPEWEVAHAKESIQLHQDANVYVSESDAGVTMQVELGPQRQIYAICIEGSLDVNDTHLSMREAAKISGSTTSPSTLKLTAGDKGAHFLMVEMKAVPSPRLGHMGL